jgi:hypothetical protein
MFNTSGMADSKRSLFSRTPPQKLCPLADPPKGLTQKVRKQVMSVACILLEVEYKVCRLNCRHVFKHTVTLSCSNAEECVQNAGKCECADAW